jgi:DnaD/phage-associated family protein
MIEYKVTPLSVSGKDAFTEASREELRVLLALIEKGGRVESEGELASLAATSRARASASLVFWEEAGVISPDRGAPSLTEEFENTIQSIEDSTADTIGAKPAKEVALDIRDSSLSGLIKECAALMGKPTVSQSEIKHISALYTDNGLSEDYIITLAAHVAEKGKLTASRLYNEAMRLVGKDITTTEELEKYIEKKENQTGAEWEFRHLVGIYNRNLSKKEGDLVNRWYYEFGYANEIVGEAYDIAIFNTGKASLPYMDKLITHWHELGVKNLAECRAVIDAERGEGRAKEKEKTPPKLPRAKKEAPRYGDFDVNDAFEKALLRSYGDTDKEEK